MFTFTLLTVKKGAIREAASWGLAGAGSGNTELAGGMWECGAWRDEVLDSSSGLTCKSFPLTKQAVMVGADAAPSPVSHVPSHMTRDT
ncbi:hypothetical protein E2C01_079234 [Portunus trituberculatus]|uniref:Uncharacterized protein n=1 Tax=Portunus trituberculatus TaxID=210409 RepID=A0A5B7IPS1_PORTR|nr:hypothetical protein [Portunus trituberculatus]